MKASEWYTMDSDGNTRRKPNLKKERQAAHALKEMELAEEYLGRALKTSNTAKERLRRCDQDLVAKIGTADPNHDWLKHIDYR